MWFYTIVLRGYANKDKTSMRFQLDTVDVPLLDHTSATQAANSIRGSLVDISNAFIVQESVTEVFFEDNQRPASDVNCQVEAVLMCHLNDPADAEKLHALRVPAPKDDLFMADGQTVLQSHANVKQFIQQVGDHAIVSDGEQINYAAANNDGLKYGYKRTKAKRFK